MGRIRKPRGDDRDEGFSLLEVVVSFTLFAAVAASATTGIVRALDGAHNSQQRTDAANIAQQEIASDIAAYQQTGQVPVSNANLSASVSKEQFTVSRTVAFVGAASSCTAGASFTIHVEVRQQQTSSFLAQSDTVVAC